MNITIQTVRQLSNSSDIRLGFAVRACEQHGGSPSDRALVAEAYARLTAPPPPKSTVSRVLVATDALGRDPQAVTVGSLPGSPRQALYVASYRPHLGARRVRSPEGTLSECETWLLAEGVVLTSAWSET